MSDIFLKEVRKCKRCGRLLFSEEALKTGYGCQCAKKSLGEEQVEEEEMQIDGQMNIMDFFTESEG